MTKTFCDICDELIPPSCKRYHVEVGEVTHNDVCPRCYRALIAHLDAMKVKIVQAPDAP